MKIKTPFQALTLPHRKSTVQQDDVTSFALLLEEFIKKIDKKFNEKVSDKESEEHSKNALREFLYDSFYKGKNEINTKERIDFAIFDTDGETPIVIIENKIPKKANADMITKDNLNAKAMHELIYYYLKERIKSSNTNIKYLIATNIYEWFIFDERDFNNIFFKKSLIKDFEVNEREGKGSDHFYNSIAKPFLEREKIDLDFTYFNLWDYKNILRTPADSEDEKEIQSRNKLRSLYKLFHPQHLLKLPFENHSNVLNKGFYDELLHILGLEDVKDDNGSKRLIRRKKKGDRNDGALLENIINKLESDNRLSKLKNPSQFGETEDEQYFGVALQLCISWIDRILFSKLLESQLVKYHKDSRYRFLNFDTIPDFYALKNLFFSVLAKKKDIRTGRWKEKFERVPYLNSSLFVPSSLEDEVADLEGMDSSRELEILKSTKLLDGNKRLTGKLPTLDYLFKFLDAYDFSSEGQNEEQKDHKELISASVLGLIFEKFNGYKDGSFFTPGFITEKMCNDSLRNVVVERFNNKCGWECKTIDDIYNHSKRGAKEILYYNQIIDEIKICDPAVGSGHFLVSALNTLIAIKSELRILSDATGKELRMTARVINDELVVEENEEKLFEYHAPTSKGIKTENQRAQEILFHEKEKLIENCLFGVDINANSVKICRLRLWIELLKNAYYTEHSGYTELEILPNIDINIKHGNSLISRFDLDDDLNKVFKKTKYSVKEYKQKVKDYKTAKDKKKKDEVTNYLKNIKSEFETNLEDIYALRLGTADGKVSKLASEINRMKQWGEIIPLSKKEELKKAKLKLDQKKSQKKEILSNAIYENSFEWRFEFPEVLNDEGDFDGFDLIIGNPPYINVVDLPTSTRNYYQTNYTISKNKVDIYAYFLERTFEIGKKKSQFTFIISHTWKAIDSFEKFRKFLFTNYKVTGIVDLDFGVFDAIVKPLIISMQKPFEVGTYNINVMNEDFDLTGEIPIDEVTSSPTYVIDTQSTKEQKLIYKIIEKDAIKLESVLQFTRGIKTSNDKKFVLNTKKDKDCFKVFRGRNIKGYSKNWDNEYIWYRPDLMKEKAGCLPHTKALFDVPEKLITQRVNSSMQLLVAYDNEQDYFLDTTIVSIFDTLNKDYSIKYILALLNSKVINFWYCNKFRMPTIGLYELHSIPIKPLKNQQPFISLVDKILDAKKKNKESKSLENKIDELVYKLYDITPDEQKEIKKTFEKKIEPE